MSISQAFQSIFAHKLRSFLTMLGIIIGIAALITIVATIQGTNEQIKENLIGAGNNVITIELYRDDMRYDMTYQKNPNGVTVADAEDKAALCAIDNVRDVAFYRNRSYAERTYYQNTAFNGGICGVDESYFSVHGLQITRGRGFVERDFEAVQKNVIIDKVAMRGLFGSDDPIGKIIEIKGEPFTVIGVLQKSSRFEPVINSPEDYELYASDENGMLYIPNDAWPMIYRFDEPPTIAVSADSTDEMTNVGRMVSDYLNETLIAESVSKAGFSYRSNDLLERAEELQEMSNATNQQLIWIALIALIVGGVGVMNIMLVSVTERTSEIGLRKAIGAKRSKILVQFLTEAAVLTGVGGVLGVGFGVGLSELFEKLLETPTSVSIPSVILAVCFSVGIGFLFGLLPAVKASKLNPIEALRRD